MKRLSGVCHAWDIDRFTEADKDFITWLASEQVGIKAGLTALTAFSENGSVGRSVLTASRKRGGITIYDGKFGDLRNQVAGAVKNAVWEGVTGLTVWADCDLPTLKTAVETRNQTYERLKNRRVEKEEHLKNEDEKLVRPLEKPILFGVAKLSSTNTSPLKEIESEILRLAENASRAGFDGMVVPGRFLASFKAAFPELKTLVVGIRPEWSHVWNDDQKHSITHLEAAACGADVLVIGRPIAEAKNPREAASRVMMELRLSTAT